MVFSRGPLLIWTAASRFIGAFTFLSLASLLFCFFHGRASSFVFTLFFFNLLFKWGMNFQNERRREGEMKFLKRKEKDTNSGFEPHYRPHKTVALKAYLIELLMLKAQGPPDMPTNGSHHYH